MNSSLYPCLWFDHQAEEAADFYCSLFRNSKVLEKTQMVSRFELNGTKFMGLNGGSKYQVNSAVSYFVHCGSEVEIHRIYDALSKGGSVLMPLKTYDWSPKYAWVIDRYGVNWQLDVEDINSSQKIVPCLLFTNGKRDLVKNALAHYTGIFKNSRILMEAPYPPEIGLPEGTLLFAQIKLDGFILNAMSSTMEHDFDFTPGNSLVVECETQEEIDYYWTQLGKDGKFDRCGWLTDRFGVSWQIVPKILGKLMTDPSKSQKVMASLLTMQKIEIETLLNS